MAGHGKIQKGGLRDSANYLIFLPRANMLHFLCTARSTSRTSNRPNDFAKMQFEGRVIWASLVSNAVSFTAPGKTRGIKPTPRSRIKKMWASLRSRKGGLSKEAKEIGFVKKHKRWASGKSPRDGA